MQSSSGMVGLAIRPIVMLAQSLGVGKVVLTCEREIPEVEECIDLVEVEEG